jgi:hypothetical protein
MECETFKAQYCEGAFGTLVVFVRKILARRRSLVPLFMFVIVTSSLAQNAKSDEPALKPEIPVAATPEKFHWGAALAESGIFLGVLHGINARQYMVPHDHFFRRYADSVADYRWDTWFDGNSGVTNNLGHPMEGAVAGSIELQNDPTGRRMVLSKDRRYWNSRLRALAWSTVFSVQWEIGPLSEASLGNYGSSTWVRNGRVVNGTGWTDFVMTPVGGLGWIIAEDAVDKWMRPRADCSMSKKRKAAWAALTPARSVANVLRWKKPWYRDELQTSCGEVPRS